MDGWWAEAYTPEVGWAPGDGQEHADLPAWDAAEAGALYDRLEREVIPEFYARDDQGIPTAWIARMRESMARLTPRFCASRTVREYPEQHYLPAALAYRERAAGKGAAGRRVVDGRHVLQQKWSRLRFGAAKVETKGDQHWFSVHVYLDELEPKAVRVELYADGMNGGAPVRQEMKRIRHKAALLRRNLERYRAQAARTECLPEELPRHLPEHGRHLEMLARVVEGVVERPLLPGNRIDPLVNGDEAYPAMLEAIQPARQTISFVTYIFDRDEVGRAFAQALGEAACRGVEVQVLIDATGTRYSWPTIFHTLRRERVKHARLPQVVKTWFIRRFGER